MSASRQRQAKVNPHRSRQRKKNKQPCQTLYSINASTLLLAWENPEFARVLERADLALADGVGAVWAIRTLTGTLPERVPGIDLIRDLVRICAEEGQSVFLLGGRPGVAERCAQKMRHEFPTLQIAGTRDGYWSPGQVRTVVQMINAARPGLLLVGLGQPAQEFFMDTYHQDLQVRVAMGVGGSFDVLAGDLKRAPRWMQRLGLEWLYRCIQEPWRMGRVVHLLRLVLIVMRMPKIKHERPKG